ncbi:MAG: amidase [Actinomycetota bacterium]|nr:amidase [Acidimicrobiia bacterium]MDQ3293237.1 amidase [Actinomycetota bacterium]
MPDTPWLRDACSLVDAFRSGERNPVDEVEAVLGAIEGSELNAFSFVEADGARARAAAADVSAPFGGVPMGVKELDHVEGWPCTEASLVFKDRIADHDSTMVARLREGGANLVGLTTASEFGGLNVSITKLNGITNNAWQQGRTAGGSSGGSAAAVAGGVVPIATGGDGGGSIRIPAGFNGLFGMKGTAGRIPRGPSMLVGPLTVVIGCLARSVRDVARWYDVCNGFDRRDPYSLPKVDGWERGLGSHELAGKKAVIDPTLGGAIVRPEVAALVQEQAEALCKDAGIDLVDVEIDVPGLGTEWAIANLSTLLVDLGDRYPDCKDDLTMEIAFGMEFATQLMNLQTAATVEANRRKANEAMADVFDQVDFVLCATNPDTAYPADVTLNTLVGEIRVGPENNGALTIPANIAGNPACSIPAGTVDGLPVGLQVIGRHHEDALLLDLARLVEHERPWPLVAPAAPR